APARAQPAPKPYTDSTVIPQTPAYRRALGLAELLNADDASRRREYLRGALAPDFLAQVPLEQHVAIIGEAGRSNGAIEVHAARSYEPPEPDTHAVLIVRSELLESWRAIVVDVEEAEPHRITGISFAPARPPSDQPRAARLTEGEIAERLGAYVDRLAGAERFSGTVLLAKDGEVLASRAVGLANRDFDVPVTMDTKFNLGSMNKMMTGIAVMQLVESGKLSLDDPISMHLSEDWLPGVDKSRVTVRHLLTHTSGLGSFFTEEWDRASRALYRSVDDWKPVVAAETLAFEPGTQSRYSNTGMLIAGAVVEHVSGQSYDEYVREHITGPAGMTDTGFFETDRVNKNLAVGYEPIPGADPVEYRNNLHQHVVKGGPAGGGYSTAPDLLKFDRALRSGRIVSRASLGQLWRAYPDLGSPNYGLGFGVFPTPAGLVVGHSGGFSGISADLSMYLDEGYTFIALANLGGAAGLIEQKARELITQGR
ncbi:MAG TPA: serine hydrolase domain-containing protein, partial [Phycisphaerales bacterium]|nr:serine hydrolase domain-containing protein [Phycisphaerales bacterium]